MAWSVGTFVNFARRPFVLESCASETDCDNENPIAPEDVEVVRNILTFDALASLTLVSRLQIGLKFPVTFVEGQGLSRDDSDPDFPAGSRAPHRLSATGIGDPELEGKLRLGNNPNAPVVPGLALFVTGPLGGSILGKHLDFTPRVREALELQLHARIHAMLDISDGLAADVNHLCEESGCGAVLAAERIPVSVAARQMNDSRMPLEHALGDGEDFELAFAVSPEDGRRLLAQQPISGVTLSWIGECLAAPGLYLDENGQRRPLPATGYVHWFGD